jgi:transcriptional regulator with XRE-family HTH domain
VPSVITELLSRQEGASRSKDGEDVVAEQIGTYLKRVRSTGGWTLGKLARKAGVSKGALSLWESGQRQPRVVELEAVLEALGATAAQRALAFACIDAPRAILHLRRNSHDGLGGPPTGGDLLRAMRLRRGWSQEQLWSEVRPRIQRLLAMIPHRELEPDTILTAALMNAAARVYASPRPAPEVGIQELRTWLAGSRLPAYTAWILSDMSKYAALAGQTETGLLLAKQACRVVEACHYAIETYLRRCDYGRLFLNAGHPAEALRVLPQTEVADMQVNAGGLVLRAEAYWRLGHACEAHDYLQRTFDLVARHGDASGWGAKAARLAQRF